MSINAKTYYQLIYNTFMQPSSMNIIVRRMIKWALPSLKAVSIVFSIRVYFIDGKRQETLSF